MGNVAERLILGIENNFSFRFLIYLEDFLVCDANGILRYPSKKQMSPSKN